MLNEAKLTIDICAELNVTEVQIKTEARFAVLLDRSLLGINNIIITHYIIILLCLVMSLHLILSV